ncbi:MAG: ABC transporter ATP-binding protein [Micrococcales bacterium]|nr:ABC transporter ATP-binding protein [Micrococcales bacterium]
MANQSHNTIENAALTSSGPPAVSQRQVLASAAGLTKVYGQGEAAVRALRGVDLDFDRGQFTAIMGPSGSGKSTLMHCMAGLDRPTSGTVRLGDQMISGMSERSLTKLRRTQIGFVFQAYNLVASLTALENITLPLELAHRSVEETWLNTITGVLGLSDRLTHKPAELSGGQQQRVACARALVTRPEIVFADEPTGNLDSTTSREVMRLLQRCWREFGQSLVMVTHDAAAAAYAERVVFLADGKVAGELAHPSQDEIEVALRAIRLAAAGNGNGNTNGLPSQAAGAAGAAGAGHGQLASTTKEA